MNIFIGYEWDGVQIIKTPNNKIYVFRSSMDLPTTYIGISDNIPSNKNELSVDDIYDYEDILERNVELNENIDNVRWSVVMGFKDHLINKNEDTYDIDHLKTKFCQACNRYSIFKDLNQFDELLISLMNTYDISLELLREYDEYSHFMHSKEICDVFLTNIAEEQLESYHLNFISGFVNHYSKEEVPDEVIKKVINEKDYFSVKFL